VGARDLLELMLRGDHSLRRVYPRRWTRCSISKIIRCISSRKIRRIILRSLSLTSISLMRISSISMRIIMSSLILRKNSLILSRSSLILRSLSNMMILSSLNNMMVGVVFRGCRRWCTRPNRTAMQGGLLSSRFYLTLVDMWHAGFGMGLAFLYEQLSLTSDSFVASCGGYMTLHVVIFVFLLFYLLDRKSIVVCIILVLI